MYKYRQFANIARIIRTLRIKKGITQEELSKSLGYSNGQYISNLERLKCGLPASKISKLVNALGLETPHSIIEAILLDHKARLYDIIKEGGNQ